MNNESLQQAIDLGSFIVTVALVLAVAVALNARDWCMRKRVPFKEYPGAFFLSALATRFYFLILAWRLVFPDLSPFIQTLTGRAVFWLFLLGLVHGCRGPLEWMREQIVMKYQQRSQQRRGRNLSGNAKP